MKTYVIERDIPGVGGLNNEQLAGAGGERRCKCQLVVEPSLVAGHDLQRTHRVPHATVSWIGSRPNWVISLVNERVSPGSIRGLWTTATAAVPAGGTTTFRARNAGGFVFLSTDGTAAGRLVPKADTLYNAWFVINNATDTYQVYMQSDGDPALASITQMKSDGNISTFGFRNGAAANDLITANMGNGGKRRPSATR